MVGSVNEQWYKRWRKPGAGWDDGKDKRQYDYSWQERLRNTAHIPVIYRENRPHTEPAPAPIAQPYTSGKDVTYSK